MKNASQSINLINDSTLVLRTQYSSSKKGLLNEMNQSKFISPLKKTEQGFEAVGDTRKISLNQPADNSHFISNYIRTTKYTIYNFLVLSLAY